MGYISDILRCNLAEGRCRARALRSHRPSFSRHTADLLRRVLRAAGLMWPKRSSRAASLKCNQASSDADSPSPHEQRVAERIRRAVETHRFGHQRVGHAHPCTLLRAGRTWHHALFPSRRRPVAHQVRRAYRRYGTHLACRTLPSMYLTTVMQMARSASSCSSRSTVRRATLITTSGRAVRCDGLRAPGSTPPSPLTTESGAE